MNPIIRLLACAVAVSASLKPVMSLAENPQISIQMGNCLTDGSGTPGICAASNIKRIELEVTFEPKGNSTLKRLAEIAINPTGTMPSNYLVIGAVIDQGGAAVPVKFASYGTSGTDGRQVINVYLEILEDASVRQNKIQTFLNQMKTEAIAAGAAQDVIDKLTLPNAPDLMGHYYLENRLGRFKLSAEYHSIQGGAWNGTATSPEVTVDVVNKGSGITALQSP